MRNSWPIKLQKYSVPDLHKKLTVMSKLLEHRGPDGNGLWQRHGDSCGLAHRRLSIIDLTDHGAQPMIGSNGTVITFNGEIYNYLELKKELSPQWNFQSTSDTETVLAAYAKYGADCVKHLRGMFSFAIWDEGSNAYFVPEIVLVSSRYITLK